MPKYLEAYVAYTKIKKSQQPSIRLYAELMGQHKSDAKENVSHYRIVGKGLPKNSKMFFWSLYGGYQESIRYEVMTDSKGNLWRSSPENAEDKIPLIVSCDNLPGSCTYFFIQSSDLRNPLVSTFRIVPMPLVAKGNEGPQVEVTRIEKGASFVLIELSGFAPKELLYFKSRSGDEIIEKSILVDSNGSFSFLYAASILGRIQGGSNVSIYSHSKKYVIDYFWTEKGWSKQDEKMFDATLRWCQLRKE